jgi:hypothetical protein
MSVIVRIEAGFPHRTERLGQAEYIETNGLSKGTHRITLVAGEREKEGRASIAMS